MRHFFFPAALLSLLSVQLLACLLQLEWWPLTGHGLYSKCFHYSQARFHQVFVEFADGRVETGHWSLFRSRADDESSRLAWCHRTRMRPNFRSVKGRLSRFEDRDGKIILLIDEKVNICGT